MNGNWDAVAAAIEARLVEQGMTPTELAHKSGVSMSIVRELRNAIARRRQPRTLAAISGALKWPPKYLEDILRNDMTDSAASDPVLNELIEIKEQLKKFNDRLDSLEKR